MPKLIDLQGPVSNDPWTLLPTECDVDQLSAHAGQDVIVPFCLWQQARDALQQHQGRVAVWLDSHELPAVIADDLPALPLIALNFPEFKDGRALSSARELRERLAYQGEIRAIGDVLRDQLYYMKRCGFSSFALRDDQDVESCLQAFGDFSDSYQPAMDQPLPLFRRRAGA
jgi:uncharacterized protein (DUF934 family)